MIEARVHRCFPFSAPDAFVSIQDGAAKEVGMLATLDGLDADSRRVLDAELDKRYFTPIIRRIVSLKQEASMWRWEVDTQRGRADFYVRGVRDSIHEIAPRRWQILGMDGQRYEIRDFDSLDSRSQTLFENLF
ncbi:MAG: DUF1854 domain-containing protein [Fimbriimonadales bacterium]|nr:DUF1854 domain-containing protein [Fimbriimonadales bacterium]